MKEFYRISERIEYIRSEYMKNKKKDELLFFQKPEYFSAKDRRRISDVLSVLLVVYGSDGTEWSISPEGRRVVHRECPRIGWFHRHEYVEILYVIDGHFTQILLGNKIRFDPGEFVITDQNCGHADYIDEEDAAVLFLRVRSDYMERLLKSYDGTDEMSRFLFQALLSRQREQSFLELRKNDNSRHPDMEKLLELLFCENISKKPGHEKIEEGLMIRILQYLCSDYTQQLHSDSRESREKAFLFELERYIRKNVDSVTVAELEEQFHYHRNYYSLLLKKYRGITFRQYVSEIRMKYAKQLLEQTDLPVKRIAREVGYENTSHFYHLFEDYYDKTPNEIRKSRSD